jgi:phage baseplate assembly protein W
MPERPHFSYPFQRGQDGKVGVVEQDTAEHIMACEQVIIRCPLGFRQERPEFGWAFPEFHSVPLNLGPLEVALRRFEPRSRVRASEYASAADAAIREVQVEVEVQDG